ncbi:MAG: hypothetical protein ABWX59_09725 [Microbacteriaceae bacterium]
MCLQGSRRSTRDAASVEGATVLDLVYVLGVIAVFVLVGLAARGVDRL